MLLVFCFVLMKRRDIMPTLFSDTLHRLGFEEHHRDGTTFIVPPTRLIPAGTFTMGSAPDDPYAQKRENEFPQHEVYVDAFALALYPVTVAEYACAVAAGVAEPINRGTPHLYLRWEEQLQYPENPVVGLTWKEARAYTDWLSKLTGQRWRLPTEAEWEKAARGTDQRIYPWGNEWDSTRANSIENNRGRGIRIWRYPGGLVPIGRYPDGASPYGIYEMAGNIDEWCSSLFRPYPYVSTDGRERFSRKGRAVLRGGSWCALPEDLRVTYRAFDHNGLDLGQVGFRLALNP
jgi:formylglycine-generating enzyme required for sulfatase activity